MGKPQESRPAPQPCRVKLCGVTTAQNAEIVAKAGADMMGLIFVPNTPRTVKPQELEGIFEAARFKVKVVGVFRNQPLELVQELSESLPFWGVQLHGDESPEYCAAIKKSVIKVFSLEAMYTPEVLEPYRAVIEHALLDWPKGKPGPVPWEAYPDEILAEGNWPKPLLAGKLTPQTVGGVVKRLAPWGVDVASGVECQPGVKDADLCRQFVEAAKANYS